MRPFTKLIILALACALNAASAHASGLHELPAHERDVYLKALRVQSEKSHARKLLAGLDCVQHALSPNADFFVGGCDTGKDEDHWCETSALAVYDPSLAAYATNMPEICIADYVVDCCLPPPPPPSDPPPSETLDAGAIAGIVVGCVVGVAGIVTLVAFLCKCCCFRPKQVLVMQQQQPQLQYPVYVTQQQQQQQPVYAMQQPRVVVVPAGAK